MKTKMIYKWRGIGLDLVEAYLVGWGV